MFNETKRGERTAAWGALRYMVSTGLFIRCSALDFMHATFLGKSCVHGYFTWSAQYHTSLGIVATLFSKFLFAAHIFSGPGGADSAKQRLEDIINAICWPSHITRLPKNVCISSSHSRFLHTYIHIISLDRTNPSRKQMNGDDFLLSPQLSCGMLGGTTTMQFLILSLLSHQMRRYQHANVGSARPFMKQYFYSVLLCDSFQIDK